MGSEKFCLRWNDFESNISSAFREIRDDKDFFDVTLACEDEQIQAHKVILAACSQFFRNILRRNTHQHPLLYLKGVRFPDLQAVLNFMYHGEVNVAQEELNSFLAVAEDLRVKGLTQNQPAPSQSQSYSRPKSPALPKSVAAPSEREVNPIPKRPKLTPTVSLNPQATIDDDEIQEVVSVKTEPRDALPHQPPPQPHPMAPPVEQLYTQQASQALAPATDQVVEYQDDSYEDYGDYSGELQGYDGGLLGGQEADGSKGSMFEDPSDLLQFVRKDPTDSKFYCTLCSKFSHQTRANTRNHVESKHFPNMFHYQCDQCEMSFNTKSNLAMHRSRKHRQNKESAYGSSKENVFYLS